jgi:hypothetical protein
MIALHVVIAIAVLGAVAGLSFLVSWSITRQGRSPETRAERFAEHFCWSRTPFSPRPKGGKK